MVCAAALCDDDLHVRSVPLWQQGDRRHRRRLRRQRSGRPAMGDRRARIRAVLHRDRQACRGGAVAASGWCSRARRADGNWPRRERNWNGPRRAGRPATSWAPNAWCTEAYPVIRRYARANDVSRCWLYFGSDQDGRGRAAGRRRVLGTRRAALARARAAAAHPPYSAAAQLDRDLPGSISTTRSTWSSRRGSAWIPRRAAAGWRMRGSTTTSATCGAQMRLADLGFDGAGDPDEDWRGRSAVPDVAGRHALRTRNREAPHCTGEARQGRRAEGARRPGRRLGALLDRRRRGQVAMGDLRVGPTARRRLRRRVGVGERRAGRRADRISQRPRNVQCGTPADADGLEWSRVATAAAPIGRLGRVGAGRRRDRPSATGPVTDATGSAAAAADGSDRWAAA